MFTYVIRRLGHGLIVILGVTFITFMIPAAAHVNYAKEVLGQHATWQQIQAFNHKYGLDKNIFVQYLTYMNHLIHGNLGVSFGQEDSGSQVSQVIGNALWDTIWIILASLIISLIIAIPLGLAQAIKRNSAFDYVATSGIFVLYSTPAFVLGSFLILVFAINLHWLPYSVEYTYGATGAFARLLDMFKYPTSYILPVAVLTALTVGGFSRFMRGSVLDTLVQDYIRTARAKGASSKRVLYKHAFRNAIIPIVTLLGLSLPALFAGAVITESLFNMQGMGSVTVQAVYSKNIPVIMAATLLVATATVLGNIAADLGVAAIDPRIRLTAAK
jgi:peptide/nickel transport system permease protein